MCERKAKKDAPADVVSRAAWVSQSPLADASRQALAGWCRPVWFLASSFFRPFFCLLKDTQISGTSSSGV